jgi:hypothetical protein
LRSRLAPGLARHLERLGVSSENARRLESKLTTAGACGSCNECNACATDPGQGSALEESPEQALSSSLYPVIPIRIDKTKREY